MRSVSGSGCRCAEDETDEYSVVCSTENATLLFVQIGWGDVVRRVFDWKPEGLRRGRVGGRLTMESYFF